MSDNPPYFARLVLTHGAGAPIESEFMQDVKQALNRVGIDVRLFNFTYMQKQVETQKKRPPSKKDVLIDEFLLYAKAQTYDLPLFVGGKSMGGRIATHIGCDETLAKRLQGVVVFGYPFHPPGKLDKLRIEHFSDLRVPVLIHQGERDTFGKREDVVDYELGNKVQINWLVDGDHSLKPRKASGTTQHTLLTESAEKTRHFMYACIDKMRSRNAW